jgi:HD-GYP domain-containing protein (c-di-GMP phosphodiesterase class II)
VRITSDTRARFRQMMRGIPAVELIEPEDASIAQRALSKLRSMLGAGREAAERDLPAGRPAELDALLRRTLPPGTALRTYVDRHPVAEELPRARQAFAQAEEAVSAVVADIRAGRVTRVGPVEAVAGWLVDSMIDNPDALMWVAQLREQQLQPHQHGVRVALHAVALGRQLGLPRGLLGHLAMTGILSDVGKTRLPRALLDKPGLLNPAEYSIVKEHVRLGLEMLSQAGALAPEIAAGIAQHHERLDGSGYPKGLKGDEVSLYGRIAGIADSFTALITPRIYANPLAPQDALMSLYQWAGTSFDASLVEQFVQSAGVFPVGTLVELSGGEVCVVLANNRQRRLEPRVMVLTWPDKRVLPVPVELDLVQPPFEPGGRPLRIVRGLPSGAYGIRLRDYYAEAATAESR